MPNNEILSETKGLRAEVRELREELAKSKGVVRRLRILTAAVITIFVVGGVGTWYSSYENKQNAIVNCENNNESRKAILEGWHFILGAELADEDNNPAETRMSELILPWFDIVYQQRDCSDLSKKYEIPPVPKIPMPNRENS